MIYLNQFRQLTDGAADALGSLVKDLINKNTTNILEVGTYAGQVTIRLCAAAAEKNEWARIISIDKNRHAFSPSAEDSLKANNLRNYSVIFGNLAKRFEENIIRSNIIYIDRFHNKIDEKMEVIKKNVIVPTKVIFRNPKNSGDFPFEVTEVAPEVKPRSRKKASVTETTADKTTSKETKKETT